VGVKRKLTNGDGANI